MSSDISLKTYNAACDYPITTPSGKIVEPPAGRCWSLSAKAFAFHFLSPSLQLYPNIFLMLLQMPLPLMEEQHFLLDDIVPVSYTHLKRFCIGK